MAVPAPGGRRSWRLPLQVIAVAVVAALLGLLVWRLVTQGRGSHLVATVAQGKHPAAPGFVLRSIWPHTETWPAAVRPALDDGRLALAELRGYPVVLNFWASWCVPCKAEAPRFAASARAHAGKVAFVGVDIQDFTGDARRFLRRVRSNYVTVRDGGDATYSRYGLTGVPETYFVDRRGRIAAHSIGEISRRELEQGVAAGSRDTSVASGPPPGPYRGSQPPPGIQAPDFDLRSTDGRQVRMREFRGRVVLTTFVDTACRESCPVIVAALGAGLRRLPRSERRQVVALALTVDPKVDTPAHVRRFLRARHALGELIYLVGPVARMRPVWHAYGILPAVDTGKDDIHSADVRVFDRQGIWVSTLHVGVDLTPANIAHDVELALRRNAP